MTSGDREANRDTDVKWYIRAYRPLFTAVRSKDTVEKMGIRKKEVRE